MKHIKRKLYRSKLEKKLSFALQLITVITLIGGIFIK